MVEDCISLTSGYLSVADYKRMEGGLGGGIGSQPGDLRRPRPPDCRNGDLLGKSGPSSLHGTSVRPFCIQTCISANTKPWCHRNGSVTALCLSHCSNRATPPKLCLGGKNWCRWSKKASIGMLPSKMGLCEQFWLTSSAEPWGLCLLPRAWMQISSDTLAVSCRLSL